jgi:hypothetical protein
MIRQPKHHHVRLIISSQSRARRVVNGDRVCVEGALSDGDGLGCNLTGTKQEDCDVAVEFVSSVLPHQNSALFAAASCLNQRLKVFQRESRVGDWSGAYEVLARSGVMIL